MTVATKADRWITGARCEARCGYVQRSWGGEFCCPDCGADVDAFARIMLVWVPEPRRWWDPTSWAGGEWQIEEED